MKFNTISPIIIRTKRKIDDKIKIWDLAPSDDFFKRLERNLIRKYCIFNNDFSLLKVINNSDGTKTIRKFDKPPVVIKSGLLPQDMLKPKNLIIPEKAPSRAGDKCLVDCPLVDSCQYSAKIAIKSLSVK